MLLKCTSFINVKSKYLMKIMFPKLLHGAKVSERAKNWSEIKLKKVSNRKNGIFRAENAKITPNLIFQDL